jgi:hypothetical protein
VLILTHRYGEPLITSTGNYRARVYGRPRSDGRWEGWLVFFPVAGGRVIATDRETTQSSRADLEYWASGLTDVYLEGALERALALQPEAQLAKELAELERLEATAEARAETLELEAAAARAEARAAEAASARTEERLLETIADTADAEAEAHEKAAAAARGAARAAEQALHPGKPRPSSRKKK